MEFFWYVIASILAGVGTGLAGLSAATVMVPILFVLCPSFASETGAYQATAIALASDILGSAVTTSVYIKNKNIDLKRGWIMLVCILSMCIVGSIAAWKAGNVVLGSFTLFLTFFIGIRFLIKPDTTRKETVKVGSRLDLKGVIISLFFGLTIGFGTGFVGSGGGMMMLVVFTAFLGMELKPAVGTSTFIMTFTALIASVAHICIHPAILLERWPVLLICISVTTLASLVSAKFANKVENKIVGLVTGAVLTVLGALMLAMHYWDALIQIPYFLETCICFYQFLLYIIPFAIVLLASHFLFKIPHEVFRKMLHLPAMTSTAVIALLTESWQVAALTLFSFAIIVYPILWFFERFKAYGYLLKQRRSGEIKESLLLLYLSNAIFVAICGGIFKNMNIAVIAILMWGFGDAAAALIGKRFGRHHIQLPLADHKKTWEGSLGMVMTSFIIGVITILYFFNFSIIKTILIAFIVAVVGAYIELITHKGYDTVTVPSGNIVLLLLLL